MKFKEYLNENLKYNDSEKLIVQFKSLLKKYNISSDVISNEIFTDFTGRIVFSDILFKYVNIEKINEIADIMLCKHAVPSKKDGKYYCIMPDYEEMDKNNNLMYIHISKNPFLEQLGIKVKDSKNSWDPYKGRIYLFSFDKNEAEDTVKYIVNTIVEKMKSIFDVHYEEDAQYYVYEVKMPNYKIYKDSAFEDFYIDGLEIKACYIQNNIPIGFVKEI